MVKTSEYLEELYPGMKSLLDALGTFYSANVEIPQKTLVMKYAGEIITKNQPWNFNSKNELREALKILGSYDVLEIEVCRP